MSALPPKADMCSALAHVCFGPKADIASSRCDTTTCSQSITKGKREPKLLHKLRWWQASQTVRREHRVA